MKYSCSILLILTFLLSGCFSGKEYPSGLLDSGELLKMEEERQMAELRRTRMIRIGIPGKENAPVSAIRKKLEKKGWKVQLIVCPENRLTGLMRNGLLDIIYVENASEESAGKFGFYYYAPVFFIKNKLLYQVVAKNP